MTFTAHPSPTARDALREPLVTDTEKELLGLLIASAYANYSSSLIGGPAISLDRFNFLSKPRVGDLVMEVSSLHMRSHDEHRIGWLVSDQYEPYGTDQWWEENKADYGEEPRPQERVFTIKRLVGGETSRWTNAMMVRVVTKITGEFP
jgi:hypothetical protein